MLPLRPNLSAGAAPPGGSDPQWRVALYSHDTMGLGHMRRNLLIARSFRGAGLSVAGLLIAGAREVNLFAMPSGIDALSLPALHKMPDGRYRARSLGVTLPEIQKLRAWSIQAAVSAFNPHVLIVDNVPRGAAGELTATLQGLRAHRRTAVVLGLRDVLDDPDAVRREWAAARNEEAIRDLYDAVWVYGDPTVYDLVTECRFPADIAARVEFTGYLDRRGYPGEDHPESGRLPLLPEPYVLCTVGGGQDGALLAEAFALADFPRGTTGVILTGPYMAADTRARLRRNGLARPHLRIVEFTREPLALLERAERVVAMGGYNTVSEVLSLEKPALIVPRVTPRREQWIRAERLRALGLLEVLAPEAVAPQALTRWLRAPSARPAVRGRIDMDGLTRLPAMLSRLLPPARSGAGKSADHRLLSPAG